MSDDYSRIILETAAGHKLVLNQQDGRIALINASGNEISISDGGAIEITANASITVKAPNITLDAAVQLELKGATVKVNGTALVDIKGALVTIN